MEITDVRTYFLLFVIYSFIGWIVEIIYTLIEQKKLVNRGFFIGPYCPIYGFGCLAILILLKDYAEHPVALFVNAIVICSILEYFTSYFMEKIFKARWWDYSNKKFNLNGRICLETTVPFGLAAFIVWYGVNPVITKLLSLIPNNVSTIIAITLSVILLIDAIISFNVINGYRNTIKKISTQDITEDFNKYTKSILEKQSYLKRRLISAFPRVHLKDLKEIIKTKTNRKR